MGQPADVFQRGDTVNKVQKGVNQPPSGSFSLPESGEQKPTPEIIATSRTPLSQSKGSSERAYSSNLWAKPLYSRLISLQHSQIPRGLRVDCISWKLHGNSRSKVVGRSLC